VPRGRAQSGLGAPPGPATGTPGFGQRLRLPAAVSSWRKVPRAHVLCGMPCKGAGESARGCLRSQHSTPTGGGSGGARIGEARGEWGARGGGLPGACRGERVSVSPSSTAPRHAASAVRPRRLPASRAARPGPSVACGASELRIMREPEGPRGCRDWRSLSAAWCVCGGGGARQHTGGAAFNVVRESTGGCSISQHAMPAQRSGAKHTRRARCLGWRHQVRAAGGGGRRYRMSVQHGAASALPHGSTRITPKHIHMIHTVSLTGFKQRSVQMAESPGSFPLFKLPTGLLDRVIGCLELWDLAAARSACKTLRAAAGRRATRLVFSPASLQDERDSYAQVGQWTMPRGSGGAGGGAQAKQTHEHIAQP
jgi:hypothetical protein